METDINARTADAGGRPPSRPEGLRADCRRQVFGHPTANPRLITSPQMASNNTSTTCTRYASTHATPTPQVDQSQPSGGTIFK